KRNREKKSEWPAEGACGKHTLKDSLFSFSLSLVFSVSLCLCGSIFPPGEVHDHAEAVVVAAVVGVLAVAVGGAAGVAAGVPAPAAQHAHPAARGAFRVAVQTAAVVVLLEPIAAPLPDVAVHVVQAEGVGLVRADGGRAGEIRTVAGAVGVIAVEVRGEGAEAVAVVEGGRRPGAAGVLPLGLGRQ